MSRITSFALSLLVAGCANAAYATDGIGVGVGLSVGGGSVAEAGVGASVGGGSVAGVGVGASVGGGSVAEAGVGASVGSGSVADLGVGATVGSGSVAGLGVGATVGGGSVADVGVSATVGATQDGGTSTGPSGRSGPSRTDGTQRSGSGVTLIGQPLISRDGATVGLISGVTGTLICTQDVCVQPRTRPLLTAEGLVVNIDSARLR
jgi:hypothetical protein